MWENSVGWETEVASGTGPLNSEIIAVLVLSNIHNIRYVGSSHRRGESHLIVYKGCHVNNMSFQQ